MTENSQSFQKIHRYAKQLDKPLYEWLSDERGDIIVYSSSMNNIVYAYGVWIILYRAYFLLFDYWENP